MADICTIYKITNLINGKLYIGQTWQALSRRFSQHCTGTACIKLRRAIEKYGRDNFQIEPLTIVHSQENADYWEDYFIKQFDAIVTGYNIKEGGSHGKHTEETRRKMSKLKTNPSDEVRRNLSKSHIGHKDSDETKLKKSLARMGFKFSDSSIKKMSESQKGKTVPLEQRQKISKSLSGKKRHDQRKLNNEQYIAIINDPRSSRKIAKDYSVSYATIQRVKNKKRETNE
jgi:group I intron endonuclease